MANLNEPQKLCFVLHPTGAEWRDYVDQVFEFVITEAVESFGYTPIRADQLPDIGFISPQAIQHLAQDSLVIADLSGQSAPVLYGLALRHATQKPVIHLIREGESPVFEFSSIPVLHATVNTARDAKRCKQELMGCVEAVERNSGPQETPVSRALRRQMLEQSETLLDRRAAEMLRLLGTMRSAIGELADKLSTPENILPQDHVINVMRNSGVLLNREEFERAMGDVQGTMGNLTDRLSAPENILPQDHLMAVIKNSGMLLNRDEVDRIMSDIFTYEDDAKSTLASVGAELSGISKALYAISGEVSKHQTTPVDFASLTDRIEQHASSSMHAQDLIADALQKLDSASSTLSQLYRSVSKVAV